MRKGIVLVLLLLLCWPAWTQEAWAQAKRADPRAAAARVITPVFGQLLMFSFPAGFKPAFEKTTDGKFYINEMVPAGETVEKWTQMVTFTGAKDLALVPGLGPESVLAQIAAGFKRSCPDSYSAKAVGPLKISGHDAFIALAGCGALMSGGQARSEAVVMVAIKGSSDYYTIQWAERGAAREQVDLDANRWQERLKALGPIKVCPRLPGESAPFPSCIKQP